MNATGVILVMRKGTLIFSGAMQEPVTSMNEVFPVRDMKGRQIGFLYQPRVQ